MQAWLDSWDWADAPTWDQAVLTASALIAAVIAARQTGEMLRIENARELEKNANAARVQAEKVAVWFEHTYWTYDPDKPCRAYYVNTSGLPIYNTWLELYGRRDREQLEGVAEDFYMGIPMQTLPPTRNRQNLKKSRHV